MTGWGRIFGVFGTSETKGTMPPKDLPWMVIAKEEIGQTEVPGPADNPRILEYYRFTWIPAPEQHDSIPWCAAFVRWVLKAHGSPAARSLMTYGSLLLEPRYGAIAVLARDGGGHVGFIIAWGDKTITLLSGNQHNAVSLEDFPRNRVLCYRWPVQANIADQDS